MFLSISTSIPVQPVLKSAYAEASLVFTFLFALRVSVARIFGSGLKTLHLI